MASIEQERVRKIWGAGYHAGLAKAGRQRRRPSSWLVDEALTFIVDSADPFHAVEYVLFAVATEDEKSEALRHVTDLLDPGEVCDYMLGYLTASETFRATSTVQEWRALWERLYDRIHTPSTTPREAP